MKYKQKETIGLLIFFYIFHISLILILKCSILSYISTLNFIYKEDVFKKLNLFEANYKRHLVFVRLREEGQEIHITKNRKIYSKRKQKLKS